MAGKGKRFTFHGSFTSKVRAVRKESKVARSFVRRVRTKNGIRYLVMKKLK